MATNPDDFLKHIAEQGRRIRFGKGVVGKTGHATIGVIGLWGIVLFRLTDNLWLNATLLLGASAITGVYCWWVHRTQKFAEKNPGLALMEGAELLEYQKWDAEIKGIAGPVTGRVIQNPQGKQPQEGER